MKRFKVPPLRKHKRCASPCRQLTIDKEHLEFMNNSKHTLSWTNQAIDLWTSKGIKLQNGISIDKISDFEKLLDFKFPQDFIELYFKANGFEDFDWNEHMFSLWSLDRILKEYQEDNDTNYWVL
jgi:cell wall assembly regulator SMI1